MCDIGKALAQNSSSNHITNPEDKSETPMIFTNLNVLLILTNYTNLTIITDICDVCHAGG